jgi:hypothetical protein
LSAKYVPRFASAARCGVSTSLIESGRMPSHTNRITLCAGDGRVAGGDVAALCVAVLQATIVMASAATIMRRNRDLCIGVRSIGTCEWLPARIAIMLQTCARMATVIAVPWKLKLSPHRLPCIAAARCCALRLEAAKENNHNRVVDWG